MTIKEMQREVMDRLAPAVGEREARSMTSIILEDVKGYSPVDLVLYCDRELQDFTISKIRAIVDRVVSGEPLQYVIGTSRFMGNDFIVSPATLIPRQETSQLVDMIIKDHSHRKDLRVLDIGTGSGCIAVSLARGLKFADVSAMDVSEDAISVARRNAMRLNAAVRFFLADALRMPAEDKPLYDVIVSNPPYVDRSEASDMDSRVLDHEPHSAIFVPDDDPLLFYKAIAIYAQSALGTSCGWMYFEINPRHAGDLCSLLTGMGFNDVTAYRDYCGKYRFISCVKGKG